MIHKVRIEESNDSLGLQLVRGRDGRKVVLERVFASEEDGKFHLYRHDYSDASINFGFPTTEKLKREERGYEVPIIAESENIALREMRNYLRRARSQNF